MVFELRNNYNDDGNNNNNDDDDDNFGKTFNFRKMFSGECNNLFYMYIYIYIFFYSIIFFVILYPSGEKGEYLNLP